MWLKNERFDIMISLLRYCKSCDVVCKTTLRYDIL